MPGEPKLLIDLEILGFNPGNPFGPRLVDPPRREPPKAPGEIWRLDDCLEEFSPNTIYGRLDDAKMVVYASLEDGSLWVREAQEFFERFEQVEK